MANPNWFSEQADFALDKSAHGLVDKAGGDLSTLHRAARHHNWLQSDKPVQNWTQLPHNDALSECKSNCWVNSIIKGEASEMLVTHRRVPWLGDPDLIHRVLNEQNDEEALLKIAIILHRNLDADKMLWLGEQEELDLIQQFDSDGLHILLTSLGLWHFGAVPGNDDGAILRITYRLDPGVPLYKPDWRHGYPNFYFACAKHFPKYGMTRDLVSGNLKCKEWIAKVSDIDPYRHIISAKCVIPSTKHNYYEPDQAYWDTLSAEICGKTGAP